MSRASCIPPEEERLVLIGKWQLEACQKDACAAALLNLFEYLHNIKLEQNSQVKSYNEVADAYGEDSSQVETLLTKAKTIEILIQEILNNGFHH